MGFQQPNYWPQVATYKRPDLKHQLNFIYNTRQQRTGLGVVIDCNCGWRSRSIQSLDDAHYMYRKHVMGSA